MADLIIPDSRLEAPELFYPNRKPTTSLIVDRDNPLSRDLVISLPTQSNRSSLTSTENVASPMKFRLVDNAIEVVQEGIDCRANYTCIRSTETFNFNSELGVDFSFSFLWKKTTTPISWRYFIYSGVFSDISFYFNPTMTDLSVNNLFFYTLNNTSMDDGNWHSIIWTNDASNGYLYLDGILDTTMTAMNISSTDFLALGGRDDNTDRFSGGIVKACHVHKRAITAAEVKRLHNNFFGLYLPA